MKRALGSILLLSLALAGEASAQTADCPCPVPDAPPPQWFGKAELSFLSTSGNTDTSSVGGNVEVNYNPKPWLFTLKGAALHQLCHGARVLVDHMHRVPGKEPRRQRAAHGAKSDVSDFHVFNLSAWPRDP